MEYSELRAIALENNAHISAEHPCRTGDGRCCKEDRIPMTMEDGKEIIAGFARGEVSQTAIDQAIINAQDKERKICPFLDDQNLCTIYANRPLVCIATGIGYATIQERDLLYKAVAEAQEAGRDTGIAAKDLRSTMCAECHEIMGARGDRFSITSVVDMSDIGNYLISQPQTTTKEFVLKTFLNSNPRG